MSVARNYSTARTPTARRLLQHDVAPADPPVAIDVLKPQHTSSDHELSPHRYSFVLDGGGQVLNMRPPSDFPIRLRTQRCVTLHGHATVPAGATPGS